MINILNNKFEKFENYSEKLPGVSNGISILKSLNSQVSVIETSNEVYYYNCDTKNITGYSLVSLNTKLQQIFNEKINKDVLFNNRLYWIFCDLYDKLYQKRSYPYYKGIFTKYDIINKFIQGLRKNKKPNSLKFEITEVMKNFNLRYFEEEISPQEFYLFIIDFISVMQITDVVKFDQKDYSIEFDANLEIDLNQLIYTSFNLMILGENGIFDSIYTLDDDVDYKLMKLESLYYSCGKETKLYINSLTTSLVISSSVEKICADENINNIFIESVRQTLQ
jgi:hypothetical protein